MNDINDIFDNILSVEEQIYDNSIKAGKRIGEEKAIEHGLILGK